MTATAGAEHDVIVVGASLAGCTVATLLGRAGLRVALVEKSPDPAAFKRICSHFIQSSAVPTLERLGVLAELEAMGARRSRSRIWTRWGWILPPAAPSMPASVNIRRERLDPFLRRLAAGTEGVELMAGATVERLLRDENREVAGVLLRERNGRERCLHARLTVGADGRGSKVAKLAELKAKRIPHGRFAYAAYYEGPPPEGAPDGSLWLLDPQMVAAFPTDEGLTMYACMPTHDRLGEFRGDLERAFTSLVAEIPDAPPILASQRIGPIQGKIDMVNVLHSPTAGGLALAGDAAAALDPLWGIGCGFALQSGEWLAEAVAPGLRGERELSDCLLSYRKRYAKALHSHTRMIVEFASGRRLNAGERLVFSAAARERRLADLFEAFGTRSIQPRTFLGKALPRAVGVNVRHALGGLGTSSGRTEGTDGGRGAVDRKRGAEEPAA
jgi:2-polyprenyl-6-methoxyphenol hydroxylase-like FAD-dependent oxidoreductase